MNDTARWFHHLFFGLLLNRTQFKTLPQTDGFVSRKCSHSGRIWTQSYTENSVSMTYNTDSNLVLRGQKTVNSQSKQVKANESFTVQLHNFSEGGVLPDDNIVVSIAVGRDQLFVVGCKDQRWDLKKKQTNMHFWNTSSLRSSTHEQGTNHRHCSFHRQGDILRIV